MKTKQPFIYAIGMIQFPRVPNIERFVNSFMDLIRQEYPLDDRIVSNVINANITPEGIKFDRQDVTLCQFASINRRWGFVLSDQSLCLHTDSYENTEDFIKKLRMGISALTSIPGLNIEWLSQVGIRFVNMQVAKEDKNLESLVEPWVLPLRIPAKSLEIIESVYVARYKTAFGQLNLQALRNPRFTLPPEINSPIVAKNLWIKERPQGEFALIDIDHLSVWDKTPQKFDSELALSTISKLEKTSMDTFKLAGVFSK